MSGMTQKGMVASVSAVMGLSIEAVTIMDRNLAEAGIRTRAKRGRGHTEMTPADIASLLVAAAIGGPLKDTVAIVRKYGREVMDIADIISSRSSSTVTILLDRGAGCAVSIRVTPLAALLHFEERA